MYWINYVIKCIIRNIIYKLMKPRNLLIIIILALLVFLVCYSPSYGWEGNNNYTDKNNTIVITYESINQDLLNRLNYYDEGNNVYNDLLSDLKNNNYSYYCFYGSTDGSDMISSQRFNTQELYVYFYDNGNKNLTISLYDTYQGMTTNIYQMTGGLVNGYCFNGNDLIPIGQPSSFFIPGVLVTYKSNVLYSLINDKSNSNNQEIINSIEDVNNSVNDLTNTINNKDDNEGSSDITDSFNNMSSSTSSQDNNVDSIHNFFIDLSNIISNSLNNQTVSISFPVPFTEEIIEIKSDIIFNIIRGTLIYTLLQLAYYTLFGFYIITQVWRILLWFQSGNFINGKFVKTENLLNDMLM